jgi:segregation and condensation protein B
MSDIEKEKDMAPNDEAESAKKGGAKKDSAKESLKESSANSARTNLRDLVLSAGSALGDLLGDVAPENTSENTSENIPHSVADEATSVDTAPEHMTSQATSGVVGHTNSESEVAPEPTKKSRKKKTKKAERAPEANSVEWNESTAGLDFVESDAETTSRFEELARRVADTVSKNQDEENSQSAESTYSGEPFAEAALESSEADESIEAASPESVEFNPESAEEFNADDTVVSDAQETRDGQEPQEPEMEQMGFGALEEELTAAENDADPQPTEFIDQDQLHSILESLLFSSDKPVSVSTMKVLFKGSNIRSKDITRALDGLASDYASAIRGVTLEEVNGGYQLRTKSDNAEYLRRLAKVRPFRLSGPALEVMAIVAYKQPITKHEIDEIRGVESGHLLRALMERGLICFGGKSELPGKPMTYGTTRKFLETFGLRNIRELPTLSEIDELMPEGIGDVEEKETLSDITESLSNEITANYSEGEDELQKINEQLQAVDTTSEFFEQEKQRERDRKDRERAQDIRERLVLGDDVETKDKRWLDRYEAKLHTQTTPDSASADAEPITDQLEALTAESEPAEESSHEKDEPMLADDDLDTDDMTAIPDWDDDAASDKEV